MINPITFSNADKFNCKPVNTKISNANVNNLDLPCVKNLTSASDRFVKSKVIQGPTCGIDCCAL